MQPVLIGYLHKITRRRPDYLEAPGVEEICSASSCISEDPEDRIEIWQHNEYLLYDSPDSAAQVLKELRDCRPYDLYAFKQYPIRVSDGQVIPEDVLLEAPVAPLTDDFEFLGYDAVNRAFTPGFKCSPLSCNGGAATLKTNRYCLFNTLDDAIAGATLFSTGAWEPGPYYVVEVYRKTVPDEQASPIANPGN